ncbi:DUF4932 domain-containing protein [Paraclostridium bifermentans]|uniref:DUF4932 domain-containing protein n=1 Tax=Paraclostridium bifermentans TaxID=1490 RepID=UPI00359C407F
MKVYRKINVELNLALELISIILYKSKHNQICKDMIGFSPIVENTDYTRAIDLYFNKFENHKVYKKIEEMTKVGFFLVRPIEIALSIDNLDSFKFKYDLSETCIAFSGGIDNINDLISLIIDFKNEINFEKFIPTIYDKYKEILIAVKSNLNKYPFIEEFENFYGKSANSYNLIIHNLNRGNFGINFESKKGNIDIFIVLEFLNKNNMAKFNLDSRYINTIFHELSHPIINPLTKTNMSKLKKYESSYEDLKKYKTNIAGYGDFEECINEHIIRAFSNLMTRKYCGDYYADKHIKRDYDLGYRYILKLIEKLEYYEKNRDKYFNIEDFYEELISVFATKL